MHLKLNKSAAHAKITEVTAPQPENGPNIIVNQDVTYPNFGTRPTLQAINSDDIVNKRSFLTINM